MVASYWPLIDERSRSLLFYLNKARVENGPRGFFPKPLFHYYGRTLQRFLMELKT
jgi:hypothetical protein